MENETNVVSERKKSFGKVAAFLTMEILAILAFGLGNSFIFFTILSFVLCVVLVICNIKQLNKDGFSSYVLFLFPIFIYGLLAALSYFRLDEYFNLHNNLTFLIPIGLSCIAACGYFSSINDKFDLKWVLLVIYSALAIITAINLLATIINFVPFHTLLYKGKYIYYDGRPSKEPISNICFALMGFKITEVRVTSFSLFPTMLLSAFVPLVFMNYKDNKKLFIAYFAFGLLGFIALIMTASKKTILTDILVTIVLAVMIAAIKRKWNKKFTYTMIALGILFVLGFIVMLINAQDGNNAIKSLISGNRLLNKLFNGNGLVEGYNSILNNLFNGFRLFGRPSDKYEQGCMISNSWFFDNFITAGVFGSVFFIATLVIGFKRLIEYVSSDKDMLLHKATILGFVLTFFAYSFINFDMNPYIFSTEYMPIYESGVFMICLFFMSFAFGRYEPVKEPKKKEEVQSNEEVSL